MQFSKIALVVAFATGVLGDRVLPALPKPKLADVPDAAASAISDVPVFRGRSATASGAATAAAETTRAGLRASAPETRGTLELESKWKAHETLQPEEPVAVLPDKVAAPSNAPEPPSLLLDAAGPAVLAAAAPRTRGTLQPKGRAHGTAYPAHPALKLKGVEEDVDLSSPSLFEDRVSIATNHSHGVAVQEETEFFFLIPVITALTIDEVVNDGAVRKAVGDALAPVLVPLCGWFMEVLNPLIAAIFKTIGEFIYDALDLDIVDEAAMRIINGGMANRYQIITSLLGGLIGSMRSAFDRVVRWITTIRRGLDAIGALDFTEQIVGSASRSKTNDEPEEERIKITDGKGNTGYLSSNERNLIQSSDGLQDLMNVLKGNRMISMVERLRDLINDLTEDFGSNAPSNAMDPIKDELANIFRNAQSALQGFLDKTGGLGSLQFLVTAEAGLLGGVGLEAGISIDVRQILYFLAHGFRWDLSVTQLLSFHVGYAIDIGAQGGVEAGFCVGYHIERVTGVNGFGWGFSLEGAFGYAAGVSVGWALPGSHIPNQFVAQIIGAGVSFEAAAFWNHAIIVGYVDTQLGFMLAAPSANAARFSGNPNLYYSKFTWSQLGHTLVLHPSLQTLWSRLDWNEDNWDMNSCGDFMCQPPTSHERTWSQLSNNQRHQAGVLGYDDVTWNAPTAIDGLYSLDPLEYFAQYSWTDMLEYEMNLFTCLGWNEAMWESTDQNPQIWDANWEDIGIERRVCATAIGYDRARWNGKHYHLGSVFYHGSRILLRQPDHNTYLGMCGFDTGCGGSSYGVFGYPSSSHSRTTWTVEREGDYIHLKQANHNAYLGFCGVETWCGEGSVHGVHGYRSRSHGRTKLELEKLGEYYYLKQVNHSYLGMCGIARSCGGSDHDVFGYSSRQSRARWQVILPDIAGRRTTSLLELTPSGAASCSDSSAAMTTETRCREATRQIGYSFQAVVSYSGYPSGCFCTTTNNSARWNRHCFLNTNAGRGNHRGEVLCTASTFSYELTPSGAASCPHTSAALPTETECQDATFAIGYSFRNVGTWSNYPSGCFCTTTNSNSRYNRHCYLNTHAGRANPSGEVLCRRSYELTPSGAASCPQQTSIVPTETECREATRQISYTFRSVSTWSDYPSGCFCTTTNSNSRYNRHCYLNTRAGQANSRAEVLCRR